MFRPDGQADFCSGNAEDGYRIVYNVEVYLRHMLRWEIVAKGGKQWRTLLGETNAKASALQRKERDLRIIDADERNVLSYILLTELKDAMVSDAVWPLFKGSWPPQDIFSSSFKIFNALRSKVAHFRKLTARDMRQIDTFNTLVMEMTAHYRVQRRATRVIPSDSAHETLKPSIDDWRDAITAGDDIWQDLSLGAVHAYLIVELSIRSGTIAGDAISSLVDRAGTDAFFISIDDPRVRMRIYIPKSLKQEEAAKVIAAIRAIPVVVGDMHDEHSEAEYFDLEVPFAVGLPMDFRV